jgi:hypothetical protein
MMGSIKYTFKGIDVSNIIQDISGNTYISSSYEGFTDSSGAFYQIDRPLALNYLINGIDISNNSSVNTFTYNSSANDLATPSGAKYISAICVGGGGGGGGAGGAGYDGGGKENQGGNGGNGAPGAYCAIIQYSCDGSKTFDVVVGAGGAGGGGGKQRGTSGPAGKGAKGGDGTVGGSSSLNIGTTTIVAPGGNAGFGGNGGNNNNDGSPGGNGSTPLGTTNPNSIIVADETFIYSPSYPPQTGGSGGNQGNGGKNSGNAGNAGTLGYVRVNFLYD